MTSALLLIDAFDRIRDQVRGTAGGLTPDQLAYRVDADANSIAWLLWHLTRVQDDHISDVAGTAQAWTDAGWADRFGLPLDPSDTGYGHSSGQVAAVRVESPDLLIGYHDAVHAATVEYVGTVTDGDLGRIVDRSWDPPVTLGVRLISVISDCLEHAGQAAFIRGILQRA
ncbi:DUF664 domain-containing protein [Actinomadura sp. KC06]|uniref:mycothiol transferase n=1 Tax=Actinomadura sp. KC06 TaxID=2530369 RepID=UPI00105052DC|nr:DUF664 domain-containing protein [Actinomadura sp. KC06]TDD32331.1 DUF664 domain-containing protein [Actinomadura sp. KC06]